MAVTAVAPQSEDAGFAPAGGEASNARLFDALAALAPQAAAPLPAPPQQHHHVHARASQARRTSSRSRRGMSAGDDDAEIDASDAGSDAEQAGRAGLAAANGASDRDGGSSGSRDGGGGDTARGQARPGPRDPGGAARRMAAGAAQWGGAAARGTAAGAAPAASAGGGARPAAANGQGAAAAAVSPVPSAASRPVRIGASPIVPARMAPQTPAMLERNATAKLPLATRMARAHPHREVSELFAFGGQSLYSPTKLLRGMLWWADWPAMRGYSRLTTREAPRSGQLKPAARVAYTPRFAPAPPAAPVFRLPHQGRVTLQRREDRPDTQAKSAFAVHCAEPFGTKVARKWQDRGERRSLLQRIEAITRRRAAAVGDAA